MRFRDIPQYSRAKYNVHMPWDGMEDWISRHYGPESSVNIDPDFQRAHVWDEGKQIRYVEHVLRGGVSGKGIYWNHPNWMGSFKGELVLVDGKQRLQAVMRFLNNEIPIFGNHLKSDFEDRLPLEACFEVHVNNLKTRKEVLQWYIDLNAGGVAHTPQEIQKVMKLLEKES